MGLFLGTALGFPTVLLTPMLLVIVVYWIIAAVGLADAEALDSVDAEGDPVGASAVMGRLGLGKAPVTVEITMLVLSAWFVSMMGGIVASLFTTPGSAPAWALGAVVLLIAVIAAWAFTSGAVMALQRFLPKPKGSSKRELVGRTCVIRIGTASETFGHAEILTAGGASITIPVRTIGGESLPSGSTALIFDHSDEQDVFLVTRFDPALDPGRD
ncbi:DUF1449 family protein [Nocardiopsis sp. N85]|uniref:OB-fold-containig protein n=1 Tax=Nocardiopsis sp. N85 TaxID=3029400 RepID=UPI00237FC4AA|nr:OB-fold-containig protein [Nocardiopsis sp. N85]MDE3723088.1 DUF1449 family protein [Nocardiopsis sp. N85]